MRISTRYLFSFCIAILSTIGALFPSSAMASAVYERDRGPWFIADLAYLDPLDEVRMQAALLGEQPAASSDAKLNRRLRDVDIRTALQDTLRLHWDLG